MHEIGNKCVSFVLTYVTSIEVTRHKQSTSKLEGEKRYSCNRKIWRKFLGSDVELTGRWELRIVLYLVCFIDNRSLTWYPSWYQRDVLCFDHNLQVAFHSSKCLFLITFTKSICIGKRLLTVEGIKLSLRWLIATPVTVTSFHFCGVLIHAKISNVREGCSVRKSCVAFVLAFWLHGVSCAMRGFISFDWLRMI